ncbi:MAG TPA: IclR family transcriptional regulator [Roseiarcus sp.]
MKTQNGAAVKSAARALDIVEHVARQGPVNARGISRATGVPESSLSYLLATLVDREWLAQGADRTYSAGPALARLASGARAPLVDRARPFLRALSASTGETACLFIRRGHEIEVLEVELSTHDLRFTPQKGQRMPLHSFAGGKALLARLPAAEVDAYLAEAPRARFTDHTIFEEAPLRREIAQCRERGCAVSLEEHSIGVNGVAVALDDLHSVSVAIPSPRFSPEVERHTIAALEDAAEGLVAV